MRKIQISKEVEELHFPIIFNSAETAENEFNKVLESLKKENASVICLEVFSGKYAKSSVDKFIKSANTPLPVNWIYPLDEISTPILAGAHITALKGTKPEFKATQDGAVGVFYSTESADYCRTFGITSSLPNEDAYNHTLGNLKELEKTLGLFDFKYTDIARTWFYNDNILAWYDPFNKARTEFYTEQKIFEGLLPASTGIGSPNPKSKKITSGAIALKPRTVKVFEVESPMQCGAPKYGSSFSRAVEIETETSRRIMISGTASIESGGKTAHLGDIDAQIDLTMRVIREILRSRGMDYSDTVRSVVYCLKPEYYLNFKKWQEKSGITFPHCPSYSIVCRDDLLFEVELDAVVNL